MKHNIDIYIQSGCKLNIQMNQDPPRILSIEEQKSNNYNNSDKRIKKKIQTLIDAIKLKLNVYLEIKMGLIKILH